MRRGYIFKPCNPCVAAGNPCQNTLHVLWLSFSLWLTRSFPKNILETWAMGKLLHNGHDSRHLLAEFLFSEHHIFIQTLSRLREWRSVSQMLVVSQLHLLAFADVSSEWLRKVCATSPAVSGGTPPAMRARRSGRVCLHLIILFCRRSKAFSLELSADFLPESPDFRLSPLCHFCLVRTAKLVPSMNCCPLIALRPPCSLCIFTYSTALISIILYTFPQKNPLKPTFY